jgi:hypothetical protein
MAPILDTIRTNFVSHIVAIVFTASCTGLLFYFDQRDMRKDIIDLKEWKKQTDQAISNQAITNNSIISILQEIKGIKEDQSEMKTGFNGRLDKMENKFDYFTNNYFMRVPKN